MTKHDPRVAFYQIYIHAIEAVDLVKEKTRKDLDSERVLNLALTRLVEIIGEAANRIPDDIQAKYPGLPWLQMIGARNRLIHGYDNVDFDILWTIVRKDLPKLIEDLENEFDFN